MRPGLRKHLTYANVMASLGVFLALGGGAYAATTLQKNSVGPKQIRKNAVTGKKVKNRSLTGADVNLKKLGKVPSAATADRATSAATADTATSAGTATTASNLAAPEAFHEVGAPGDTPFSPGASNFPSPSPDIDFETAGFYKDHEGLVHLRGMVNPGAGQILFKLPPGYQPRTRKLLELVASCRCPTAEKTVTVQIIGPGVSPGTDGNILADSGPVSLDGLTFRAGP
jgi:hypothetical protein